MQDVFSYLDDEIFTSIRADFLTDARERLDAMESAAAAAEDSQAPALIEIRRQAHNLKGMGGSFGFPSITLIAHRLEDFAAELSVLAGRHIGDVLAFVDCLRDIVEAGRDPGDAKTGELLRALPAHAIKAFEVGEAPRIEALLVIPSRALGRMLTGELRALGFRVTTARSPWQALEMAARTAPDLIITSAVMDQVTGVDLARALRAMSVTERLPLALLTSFSDDHPEMRRLPNDVAIIHLGPSLSDELGDAVTRFALA